MAICNCNALDCCIRSSSLSFKQLLARHAPVAVVRSAARSAWSLLTTHDAQLWKGHALHKTSRAIATCAAMPVAGALLFSASLKNAASLKAVLDLVDKDYSCDAGARVHSFMRAGS